MCRVEYSIGRQDETPSVSGFDQVDYDFHKININDLSAREIEEIADKAAKKEVLIERNRPRRSPSLSLEAKISQKVRVKALDSCLRGDDAVKV